MNTKSSKLLKIIETKIVTTTTTVGPTTINKYGGTVVNAARQLSVIAQTAIRLASNYAMADSQEAKMDLNTSMVLLSIASSAQESDAVRITSLAKNIAVNFLEEDKKE